MTALPHVMIDIETLGRGRDAAILQVAAVRFDPLASIDGEDSGAIQAPVATFRENVDFSSGDFGTIEPDTLLWWLKQDRDVLLRVTDQRRALPLHQLLLRLQLWLKAEPVTHLWSKAPTFDTLLLRDAFARIGLGEFPIGFRAERCFRTLQDLGTWVGVEPPLRVGSQHDALDDALHQTGHAIKILRKLAGKSEPLMAPEPMTWSDPSCGPIRGMTSE